MPDGQISDLLVESPLQKYFGFRQTQITSRIPVIPSHTEGRLAIVTNAGRDAVDAGGAKDESAYSRTAKSCGPDAPTLVSSSRKQFRG